MDYNHNEIHRDVEKVKGVMLDNIDTLIGNQGDLHDLQSKTSDLSTSSQSFRKNSKTLKCEFLRQNIKYTIFVSSLFLLFIALIIFLIIIYSIPTKQ